MTVERALTWFIWIWAGLVFALNLAAVAGMILSANSFWEAWSRIEDTYSPFNFWNLAAEIAVLSPALAAVLWRDSRRKRRGK